MKDEHKTKGQLIDELVALRHQIAGLKTSESAPKEAEEQPRESHERYLNALDNMLEGCQIIGYDWRYLYVNDAVARHGRRAKEEFLGHTMMEMYPGIEDTEMFAALEGCIEKRIPHRMENEFTFPDGSKGWFDLSIEPMPEGIFILSIDITEYKRAEEQVLRQNAMLKAINKVFRETLVSETDEEVARACLAVAEELTGSKFGFVGEINRAGLHDTIALSNPGWDACKMPKSEAPKLLKNMEIRGMWGRVFKDEQSLIVNDPASHPDRVGTPKGHPQITSFLGVPLKQAGRTIGMIGLANKESGYDLADQQAVESLSTAFVEGLDRKRMEQTAQRRLERLEALRDIDRAISSTLELKDVLEVLLGKLTNLPHVDGASVMVLKPGTKELETVAVRGLSEEFIKVAPFTLKDGLPHLVVEQQTPLVIADLMEDEREVYRDLLQRNGLASYVGLPLLSKGQVIGVIGVYSRERHLWSQEQTDFLHTLAGQAAIAIYNAELYDEVLRRVRTVEAMREIDRTVLAGLTLKEVTEAIATTIGRLIPYDRASIAVLEDGTFAIVASLANGEVAMPKETKISAAETFLSEVVAGQHPVYRPDISKIEHLYRYDKQLLEQGISSDLIIPLIARAKVMGTLNLGRYQRNGFDEKVISLAEELAKQLAIAIDNALAYQRLKDLNLQTIAALSEVVGARDPYTQDHSAQVTTLGVAIAERMDLPEEEIESLRIAGLLHDIGKVGIPDSVLNKPTRLTSAEFTMIAHHPVVAAEMVEKIGPLRSSVPAIRHHHERCDGKGYPDGLRGEEIPLLARIMAVADSYNAMTSERPYRRAKTKEEAISELKAGAGTQWDPEVVKVLLEVLQEEKSGVNKEPSS